MPRQLPSGTLIAGSSCQKNSQSNAGHASTPSILPSATRLISATRSVLKEKSIGLVVRKAVQSSMTLFGHEVSELGSVLGLVGSILGIRDTIVLSPRMIGVSHSRRKELSLVCANRRDGLKVVIGEPGRNISGYSLSYDVIVIYHRAR